MKMSVSWISLAGQVVLSGLVVLSGEVTTAQGAAPSPLRDKLLVVYNQRDPDAKSLAEYYMERRGIPADRILAIDCPTTEVISRWDFDQTIRKPIVEHLEKKGWMRRVPKMLGQEGNQLPVLQAKDNQIWAMVLIRGIPLKIAEDPSIEAPEGLQPALRMNRAAVDSDLALITFENLPLPGFIGNLYYANASAPDRSEKKDPIRPFSQEFADFLIMVTRLDAPRPEQVKGMIDRAIATEELELTGRAYFDARGIQDPKDPYLLGDQWIRRASDLFRVSGFETTLDETPSVVPDYEPWEDVAIYAGWYTEHWQGPFRQPGFKFRPGAVAYHIHSFSADSIRTVDRNWVGPLINQGVTATMGSVYEPYLRFTPEVPTFFAALLQGLTFAEAAYQSQIGLSWMVTVVGDPLYRPFPRNFYDNLKLAETRSDRDLPWLKLREGRLTFLSGMIGETNRHLSAMVEGSNSPVVWEGYADMMAVLSPDRREAWKIYEKVMEMVTEPKSKIRVGLKLARSLEARQRWSDALNVYERLLKAYPAEGATYHLAQQAYALVTRAKLTKIPPGLEPFIQPLIPPPAATEPTAGVP
jgi:uncharacterized protein (TIGR03790 family)